MIRVNTSFAGAAAASRLASLSSLARMNVDIYNTYNFAKKCHVSKDDANMFLEVGWKFILFQPGFTFAKPDKFLKKINKLVQKRTYRRFAKKWYTNVDDKTDLKLLPVTQTLLKYHKYIKSIWDAGNKKTLKKADKETLKKAEAWLEQ